MKLFYRTFGFGHRHLVILHGLFGMSDNWVSLAKRLSEHFTVIVPDLPNHGNSFPMPDFTYENMVLALDDLFDELGIENLNLLGHSMGGKLAMLYAVEGKYPIEKLIVADISLRAYSINDEHIQVINAIKAIPIQNISSIKEAEIEIRKFVESEKLVLFVLKNIKRKVDGNYDWKLNLPNIELNLPVISGALTINKTFEKPCLILKGEKSNYILKSDLQSMLKVFPNAHLKTIENAGHWLHVDNTESFYNSILLFLK